MYVILRKGITGLFVIQGFAICVGGALRADTIRLTNGNQLENVIVQRMGAARVTYRTRAGKTEAVPSNQVIDIVYAPVSVPEMERKATRLPAVKVHPTTTPASTTPSARASLASIEKKWNDFELRSRIAQGRLQQVISAIKSTSREIDSGTESRRTVARSYLNTLLKEKKKHETEREEIRAKQKALTEEFLKLARLMRGSIEFEDDSSPPVSYAALMRSAFLPGWGQLYRGRYLRSSLIGLGALGLGAGLAANRAGYASALGRRDNALRLAFLAISLQNASLRDTAVLQGIQAEGDISSLARINNTGSAVLAALYGLNLIDAFIGGDMRVSMGTPPGEPGVVVGWSVGF